MARLILKTTRMPVKITSVKLKNLIFFWAVNSHTCNKYFFLFSRMQNIYFSLFFLPQQSFQCNFWFIIDEAISTLRYDTYSFWFENDTPEHFIARWGDSTFFRKRTHVCRFQKLVSKFQTGLRQNFDVRHTVFDKLFLKVKDIIFGHLFGIPFQ